MSAAWFSSLTRDGAPLAGACVVDGDVVSLAGACVVDGDVVSLAGACVVDGDVVCELPLEGATLELFVTDCAANVATSLPAASCSPPVPGLVYATVTVTPWATADASVNTDVDPEFTTDDTVTDDPPAVTANAPTAGTVADSGSSNVNVRSVPFDANDGAVPDAKAGAVVSTATVELLTTNWSGNVNVRFGVLSVSAKPPVDGAAYATVTVAP